MKKAFVMVLVLALLMASVGAMAEGNSLSDNLGAGANWTDGNPGYVPSKTVQDLIQNDQVLSKDGEKVDCEFVVVEPEEKILVEAEELYKHIVDEQKSVISYFDEETRQKISLLLPEDQDLEELVAYEVVSLMAKEYVDTYGDVVAVFSFPTPYEDGQSVVAVLALPDEEGKMTWTPLQTEVKDGVVQIVFTEDVIPVMMDENALLLVLSTPLSE